MQIYNAVDKLEFARFSLCRRDPDKLQQHVKLSNVSNNSFNCPVNKNNFVIRFNRFNFPLSYLLCCNDLHQRSHSKHQAWCKKLTCTSCNVKNTKLNRPIRNKEFMRHRSLVMVHVKKAATWSLFDWLITQTHCYTVNVKASISRFSAVINVLL